MFKFLRKKNKQEEIMIDEMKFSRESGFQLSISHPMLHKLCCELAKFFKENGGINFVSMTMFNDELGMFDLIMQRHNGKTAQQIVFELQKEVQQLKQKLSEKEGAQ
jgi:hypothetical protein